MSPSDHPEFPTMALLFKSQPTKLDIDTLVTTQVRESITLDYKEALALGSDAEKKEFLADVASFANTRGGELVFGISECRENGKTTGLPEEALGLGGVNADQSIRQMEAVISSGLAPRVPGVRIYAVEGFPKGPVLVVHVPRSWAGPHMLNPPQNSRFYGRTSAGKNPLDVSEIRTAFALTEDLPERIKRLRKDRLASVAAGETPVELNDGSWIALHLVPISALESRTSVDVSVVVEGRGPADLRPMMSRGWNHRYNLDGACTWDPPVGGGRSGAYSQLFRSGVVEAVTTHLIRRGKDGRPTLFAEEMEEELLRSVADYLGLLVRLGIEAPVVVTVSLMGTKHAQIPQRLLFPEDIDKRRVDRDELLLPDVWLDDLDVDFGRALRPIFDALWQSAGFPQSPCYAPDGSRKRR